MGYCGAASLDELRSSAPMAVTVSRSSAELPQPGSLRESHPHDVTITREAPNYRMYSRIAHRLPHKSL